MLEYKWGILSRYWAALDRDTVAVRRSEFSVSSACHNRYTWLATSVHQLTLLAVVRNNSLCHHCRDVTMPYHDDVTSRVSQILSRTGKATSKPQVKIGCILYLWHHGIKIQLCCYAIRFSRHPAGSQRAPSWPQVIISHRFECNYSSMFCNPWWFK